MRRELKSFVCVSAFVAAFAGGIASAQTNVLQNSSFETPCSVATGWQTFGNVYSESAFASTGNRALKVFGPFCCPLGYSGFFQDTPTTPGQIWSLSANVASPDWDPMRWDPFAANGPSGSHAFLEIQFLDGAHNIIHAYGLYRSPELNTGTGGIPVPLSTDNITTPVGAAFVRVNAIIEQGQWVGGAAWFDDMSLSHPGGQNLLNNYSFETQDPGCGGSHYAYWTNFGNGASNPNDNPRTGAYAAKLWGGYYAPVAYSGWYQDVAGSEGSKWNVSGWGKTVAGDRSANGNDTFVTIEFWDANGHNISGAETQASAWRSSALATGTASDYQYHFFQSGEATAPAGTAIVRAMIMQYQTNYAGGATWWDDVQMFQTNAVTCYADYNQDGGVDGSDIEAFFADWSNGDAAADVNQDGGVDGGDIEGFFIQWQNGGC
jgi:hypothetical protein